MVHNSVAEILSHIDESRARLVARVEELSEAQATRRPRPEAWSVAEIVEHLSIIERQLTQLLGMMVRKAEAGGALRAADAGFAPVSIDEFTARARGEKYTAPEGVRPTGQVSVADSLARLRHSRAALHELRPRIEQVDGAALQYPHPIFGPLNLYQWLAFIGAHEDRHLRQINALLDEPDVEAAG